jgi:hypothetical protein
MRTSHIALLATLFVSVQAQAADCSYSAQEYLSEEDLSIMASVLPVDAGNSGNATTQYAKDEKVHVLYGLPDYFARLSEEDLSQIRSVQPEGKKVVYCLTGQKKAN